MLGRSVARVTNIINRKETPTSTFLLYSSFKGSQKCKCSLVWFHCLFPPHPTAISDSPKHRISERHSHTTQLQHRAPVRMSSPNASFLALPVEIRCQIYWCVGMPDVVFYDNRGTASTGLKAVIVGGPGRRSLWNTCRLTRSELKAEERIKYDFTIQIMGMVNLEMVAGRLPACMDFRRVKQVYVSLTPCYGFSVEQQARWLVENGLGMTGEVLTQLMPNLEVFQMEMTHGGQLQRQVQTLVQRMGDREIPEHRKARVKRYSTTKFAIFMDREG